MNKQTLSTVALVAGAVALFFSAWGFFDRANSGDNEAAIEQTMMWITITFMVLAVATIANALANRNK